MNESESRQTELECQLLSKFSHPNIIAYWESFVDRITKKVCIVMDFCDGGDLEKYIKARKSFLTEEHVLRIFVQICLAIKHIHDRKILHRDLKGQNIFLCSSGVIKVGDFGIARVLRSTDELASTKIGTPYYMSPEIMNNKRYNSKTDIWSLGVILYELLCLKLPFAGATIPELIRNIMYTTPHLPSSSLFSSPLRELALNLLCKLPSERPSVNNILSRELIRKNITTFLDAQQYHSEFSHTILHGEDVLRDIEPFVCKKPSSSKPASPKPLTSSPPDKIGELKKQSEAVVLQKTKKTPSQLILERLRVEQRRQYSPNIIQVLFQFILTHFIL